MSNAVYIKQIVDLLNKTQIIVIDRWNQSKRVVCHVENEPDFFHDFRGHLRFILIVKFYVLYI